MLRNRSNSHTYHQNCLLVLYSQVMKSASFSSQEALVSVAAASFVTAVFLYKYSSVHNQRSSCSNQQRNDNAIRPPHAWSWIPYLGSALAMGADVTNFIRSSAQKLKSSVFTATILGDKCVFIADSEFLTIVFRAKYSKYLDSQSLQKQFVNSVLDCNQQETDIMFREDLDKAASKVYHKHLFKGQELGSAIEQVQDYFQRLIPELTTTQAPHPNTHSDKCTSRRGWTQHNLFEMTTRAVFKATMGPFFSRDLVTDEMYDNFQTFDKGIIPLFNGAPSFLTKRARQARSYIQKRVESQSVWDAASPLMIERKEVFEGLSIPLNTMHKSSLGLVWASVGNTAPAVAWTLLLLLSDKKAWEACVTQMETVVSKRKNDSTVFTLEELDEMTYLESAFKETLRLYQGNLTTRYVVKDFELTTKEQTYVIEKGSKLMVWWGVLHRDPGVFENPDKFQFDRFVGKTMKDFSYGDGRMLTHEPIVPFGGGGQYCPGRKFASYETRLYLAMMMQAFDIQFVEGESIPDIDPANIGIGVCHPGHDVKIEIRPKGDTI